MQQKWQIIVPSSMNGRRLDYCIAHMLNGPSRNKIATMIKNGTITLNSSFAKANRLVATDDVIDGALWQTSKPNSNSKFEVKLNILFEDRHILVINKPPSLSVHIGSGEAQPTVVDGLIAHDPSVVSKWPKDDLRPGIVHRLDKGTSGLLLLAKDPDTQNALKLQFKKRLVQKTYLGLLEGDLGFTKKKVVTFTGRDPTNRLRFRSFKEDGPGRRQAVSLFSRLESFGNQFTLAQVHIHTGRTHQIRVHAAQALGHPVLGDKLYSFRKILPKSFGSDINLATQNLSHPLLHASEISFTHPHLNKRLHFQCALPNDFADYLKQLRIFWNS